MTAHVQERRYWSVACRRVLFVSENPAVLDEDEFRLALETLIFVMAKDPHTIIDIL